MGYMGSEEFIRLQFEEYLLALLSSVKYHLYLQGHQSVPIPPVEGDPTPDFNLEWIHAWRQTASFALFDKFTDSHLFDIVEPRHPTAGNLTFEDIQRRLTSQIQTLHLDERLATSKEALNKHLATGQKKVSTAFAGLWADIEAMREAQRKRAEASVSGRGSPAPPEQRVSSSGNGGLAARAPDLTAAQASVQAAGQKAGAYLSSWGAWAADRKKGWSKTSAPASDEIFAVEGKKSSPATSPSKLARWNSAASVKSLAKGTREEKGEDGIGRLDA